MEGGVPGKILGQVGDGQGVGQGQHGAHRQKPRQHPLPPGGEGEGQPAQHDEEVPSGQHAPVDEAPVVVGPGDGDDGEIGAEPLYAPGEQEGVGGDEEAGEEIQPEMSGLFPHCASTAATRSPFSLK